MFELNTKDVDKAVKEETEERSFAVAQTFSSVEKNTDSPVTNSVTHSTAPTQEHPSNTDEIKLEKEVLVNSSIQPLSVVTVKNELKDAGRSHKEETSTVQESELAAESPLDIRKGKKNKMRINKVKQDKGFRNVDKKINSSSKKSKHRKYEKPSDQVLKVYKCTLCPKVFQRSSNYNYHQRTHNPLTAKPFSCQDCKNTFHYRCQLRDHARIHTGERPFKCHSCSKTFARKGCLVAHMVTHSDALPFQCDICCKRFARKYNLAKHVQSHSGDRPYRCLNCSRRFKCKQSLDKHLRIHELNIYSCAICQESFDTKRRLTHHKINEHVSYRPFTCQICHKPFIFKSQLTYHIKEHNLERPYSCGKCNKSYFKKGHLLSHIKQYCSDFIPVSQVKLEILA